MCKEAKKKKCINFNTACLKVIGSILLSLGCSKKLQILSLAKIGTVGCIFLLRIFVCIFRKVLKVQILLLISGLRCEK